MVCHLIDNAARHASTSVKVSLRTSPRVVELTVEDDGPGVDVADRDRIFERFARLDKRAHHATRAAPGSGWPWFAASQSARAAAVTVDGSSAGGARFTVAFPT